jgi:hypothetical protein
MFPPDGCNQIRPLRVETGRTIAKCPGAPNAAGRFGPAHNSRVSRTHQRPEPQAFPLRMCELRQINADANRLTPVKRFLPGLRPVANGGSFLTATRAPLAAGADRLGGLVLILTQEPAALSIDEMHLSASGA